MLQNQSYHPSIIINNHFEEIVNRIDIETETLLEDKSLNDQKRNELNILRDKQLEKIKDIQELNLSRLPKFDEDEYRKKWSRVINDESLGYKQKLDIIKEELISIDCILVEDFKSISKICLWITAWFYNLKDLDFLRLD